jgi:predicted HAD superfamily Cof-like phosphohydrolase
MAIIIVEGCDFTGKSTLINKLSKDLGLLSLKAVRPIDSLAVSKWIEKVEYLSQEESIICDRSPLISEPIYGAIIRQNPVIESYSAGLLLKELCPIVIWCNPPFEHVQTVDNEQMTGVKENLEAIYSAYGVWMKQLNEAGFIDLVDYDFKRKDAYEDLITELEYLMSLDGPKSFDKEICDIEQFHQKFGVYPAIPYPSLLTADVMRFREKFMQEELNEFIEAHNNGDIITAFDSLIDLDYVLKGTALLMGITTTQWSLGFDCVQRANMKKMRAPTASASKRGSSLDVIKPEGWQPPEPELKKILGL